AAPGDRHQEHGRLAGAAQRPQELPQVVEQAAEAGGVAALLLVEARAAAVEEGDGETGLGEARAGVFVPAAVALDAVEADHLGARGAGRRVAAVAPAVAVAGGEGLDGEGGRD